MLFWRAKLNDKIAGGKKTVLFNGVMRGVLVKKKPRKGMAFKKVDGQVFSLLS
jgi:hypothetical protein